MTDDVKVLAEAIEVLEHMTFSGGQSTRPIAYGYLYPVLIAARSALETSVQAPAVDREALARFFDPWAWDYGDPSNGAVQVSRAESLAKADAVLASGLLRDVRDVQAEALEDAASACDDDWGEFGYYGPDGLITYGTVPEILRARAQAIREARND